MKILDQPDTPGYYWWRERPEYKWHLAKVYPRNSNSQKLYAEFFQDPYGDYGMTRSGSFYGEWVKAIINEPNEKEIEHG